VAFVDGKRVDVVSVVTRHGGSRFQLSGPAGRGRHVLVVRWYDDRELVDSVRRTIR
jgi:hypothetical protein